MCRDNLTSIDDVAALFQLVTANQNSGRLGAILGRVKLDYIALIHHHCLGRL